MTEDFTVTPPHEKEPPMSSLRDHIERTLHDTDRLPAAATEVVTAPLRRAADALADAALAPRRRLDTASLETSLDQVRDDVSTALASARAAVESMLDDREAMDALSFRQAVSVIWTLEWVSSLADLTDHVLPALDEARAAVARSWWR